MVRSVATFLTLVLLATPLMAQDDRLDDLSFDEAPLQDEAVPYFAVGLGPVLNIAFPNVDALNTMATSPEMGLDAVSTPVIQWGAEIFTAIGLVPNVRAGFSWVSGTSRTTKENVDLGNETTGTRSIEYNLSNRTIHVDYAIVPAKGLALLPGVGLGFGTQTVSSFQSQTTATWENWGTAPNSFAELERSTLMLVPRLNIEYAFTPFIALRAAAIYNWQFSASDWKGNRVATVSNVPDDLNMSVFSAQIGIFVGLFN